MDDQAIGERVKAAFKVLDLAATYADDAAPTPEVYKDTMDALAAIDEVFDSLLTELKRLRAALEKIAQFHDDAGSGPSTEAAIARSALQENE